MNQPQIEDRVRKLVFEMRDVVVASVVDEVLCRLGPTIRDDPHLPNELRAYSLRDAAKLIGISRTSLWREVRRKKIRLTKTYGLITHEELLRYLREETQLSRREQRVPRSKYRPVPLKPSDEP